MREVKGELLVALHDFVVEKFGDRECKRWMDSLSPEARKVYGKQILSGSWYPLKPVMVEPLKTLCDLFYEGHLKGAWEAGHFCAEHGLKGIFEMFAKGGSPDALASRGGLVIAAYFRPAPNVQIEGEGGQGLLRITEFPELTKYDENFSGGWVEGALVALGRTEVKVEIVKSIARGELCTEWKVSWK